MKFKSLDIRIVEENNQWKDSFSKKYGFVFHEPVSAIPNLEQISVFDVIKKDIEILENFLLNTYIIDMGTNVHAEIHEKRNAFTYEEHSWYISHNKLGVGSIATVANTVLFNLNSSLSRRDLHLPFIFPRPDVYPKLALKNKFRLAKRVDLELYTIFEKLYHEYKNF